MTQLSGNKKIAKNTLFLYFRMLLIMVVNLFAVRVVLKALGPVDYGINNVVAGLVTMFSFLTGTMVSASQRFFAFEMGRDNQQRLAQYFSLTVLCYAVVALVILISAETIGLWFLQTKLNIPEARQGAAFWAFQCSVVAFMFTLLSIPYNSVVIAREQMSIYAIVSIFEALAKLLVVFLLFILAADKLILYAAFVGTVAVLVSVFYFVYCRVNFQECRFVFFWDRKMFFELMNYSGWNLFGALSGVFGNQGINILLNIFFGPVVNAARAIAFQISSSMNQFVVNFFKAVQPQITKLHAGYKNEEMLNLVFLSSRFSFYLMLAVSLPVLFEARYLLGLWLGTVPEHVVLFSRLVIITALINSMSYPFMAAIQATGKVRLYQIVTGGLLLQVLPVSYFFLRAGFPPQTPMYVAMCLAVIAQVARACFMRRHCGMSVDCYFSNVVLRSGGVFIVSVIPAFAVFSFMEEGISRAITFSGCSLLFCGFSVFSFGITAIERAAIVSFLRNKLMGRSIFLQCKKGSYE